MHGVGVVPHDQEMVPGQLWQCRHALHGGIAVGTAGGVGKAGHTPDADDAVVLPQQRLGHIHVRPAVQHGHRDHFNAQVLADGEMAVVARRRAQELHRVAVAPGGFGAAQAFAEGELHHLVHHGQAGIAAHQGLFRGQSQYRAEQGPGLGQALQAAVVAGIQAAVGEVVAPEYAIQGVRQGDLLGAGLAAGKIQRQIQLSERLVLCLQGSELLLQVGGRKLVDVHCLVLVCCRNTPGGGSIAPGDALLHGSRPAELENAGPAPI